jgi:hypothetical protein
VVLVAAPATPATTSVIAPSLVTLTIRSARRFVLAAGTKAGLFSAPVAALAQMYLRRMLMIRIKNIAITSFVAIGLASAGAFAVDPQREKSAPARDAKLEIYDLMHAWARAVTRSDVKTMDRVLADELICTDTGGGQLDKAKYLEFVRTDFWHVDSTEFRETRIDVYGEAAVETGLARSEINRSLPPYVRKRGYVVERVTRTWIRRHGTWQCVAFQTMVVESGDDKPPSRPPGRGRPARKIDRDAEEDVAPDRTPNSPGLPPNQ